MHCSHGACCVTLCKLHKPCFPYAAHSPQSADRHRNRPCECHTVCVCRIWKSEKAGQVHGRSYLDATPRAGHLRRKALNNRHRGACMHARTHKHAHAHRQRYPSGTKGRSNLKSSKCAHVCVCVCVCKHANVYVCASLATAHLCVCACKVKSINAHFLRRWRLL